MGIENISIKEWTEKFKTLYATPDESRRPEDFWNAVMAHLSVIGEAIRKTDYNELFYAASHAFCWMCGYVYKCNEKEDPIFHFNATLSEMVALKFPDVCGHCKKSPCGCHPVSMDETADKATKYNNLLVFWKQHSDWEDRTLRQFMDRFWDIFSGPIHIQTLENIGFHLLEEAGEEAKALRQLVQFRGILPKKIAGIDANFINKLNTIPELVEEYNISIDNLKRRYNVKTEKEAKKKIDLTSNDTDVIKARLVLAKMDFVIELADTFSWYCAVLLKVEKTIEKLKGNLASDYRIENFLTEVYSVDSKNAPAKCYACHSTDCKCLFFSPRIKYDMSKNQP